MNAVVRRRRVRSRTIVRAVALPTFSVDVTTQGRDASIRACASPRCGGFGHVEGDARLAAEDAASQRTLREARSLAAANDPVRAPDGAVRTHAHRDVIFGEHGPRDRNEGDAELIEPRIAAHIDLEPILGAARTALAEDTPRAHACLPTLW